MRCIKRIYFKAKKLTERFRFLVINCIKYV